MKYHLISLGCQMNTSDSERTRAVIEKMGYSWTDHEEEAGLLGVLACSVRQKAIDKVYSRIHKWNQLKNKKNLITFVSGCLLPADREKFLKLFDIVFPMSELQDLPVMVSSYGIVTPLGFGFFRQDGNHEPKNALRKLKELGKKSEMNEHIQDFWHIQPMYASGFEAYIPIQNGCDKFCTFCAVPYTRGREVSRPSAEILDELTLLVEKGYKSITLLGQNVNSYGLDKKGKELTFNGLLKEIGEFGIRSGKEFWVYFTSPHPRDMTDEVIETISRYDCLAKQIHLPLQSGDDKVLIRMNRKHDTEKYRHIIHIIRKLIPRATIFTDFIVGFTGETDEQFANTLKLMDEFRFNMAYIAIYSPRPGAVSSKWEDDVPYIEKKRRYHLLTAELMKHSLEYNKKLIGREMRVLVREKERKEGYLSAINEGRIIVRIPSDNYSLIGSFVNVKITSASELSVTGELTS